MAKPKEKKAGILRTLGKKFLGSLASSSIDEDPVTADNSGGSSNTASPTAIEEETEGSKLPRRGRPMKKQGKDSISVTRRPKRKAATKANKVFDADGDNVAGPDDAYNDGEFDDDHDEDANVSDEDEEIDTAPKKKRKTALLLKTTEKSKRGRKPKLEKEDEALLLLLQDTTYSSDPYESSQLLSGSNPMFVFMETKNSNVRKIANSLKDKLFHLFGYNQSRLVDIVWLNEKLYFNVLHLSVKEMTDLQLNEIQGKLQFSDDTLNKLTFDEYDVKFPVRNSINITTNLDGVVSELIPGAVMSLPTITPNNPREGFILNIGGLPVDQAWSFQTNKQNEQSLRFQYLAVSISNTSDLTDPRFSMYNEGTDIEDVNGLNIYQIDTEDFKLTLVRSYISHFGVISNLKWFPCNLADDVIGILGGVFTDGKVRFIKVKLKDDIEYCELVSTSKTLEVPDAKITCYDIMSNESIVFGTNNGFIGEYHLPTETLKYVYPLMTHGITTITSNFTDYYHDKEPQFEDGEYVLKNRLVFVGSIDVQYFIDLNDIVAQCSECIRSKTLVSQSGYVPLMHLFAVNDGSRLTKVFTKRDSQININLLKNDGVSSSLATSRLHPMVLGGSSDGELFMSDSLKRVYSSRKTPLATHLPMVRILKLEYSSSQNCYRLVTNHTIGNVGLKEVDVNFTFNSSNVCINSLSWNENQKTGNWYAASSIGGLVIIEKMHSYTTVKHYNGEGEEEFAGLELKLEELSSDTES